MAKKKEEPIITQTEILAITGRAIHTEILRLRTEVQEIAGRVDTEEKRKLCARLAEMTKEQEARHIRRLEAIETMYRIQTGVELGLLAEVKEDEEHV
jgi:hypothetical protein